MKKSFLIIGAVAGILYGIFYGIYGILYVLALTFGSEGGRTDFCPYSLNCRHQKEWLRPGTETAIHRSSFSYSRYELVDHLVTKGYWKPQPSNQRWEVIYHWNRQWRGGYTPLSRQLSRNKQFWIEWTDKYPEKAQTLWPIVLNLLRSPNDHDQGLALSLMTLIDISSRLRDPKKKPTKELVESFLGEPSQITKGKDGEIWLYGNQSAYFSVRFDAKGQTVENWLK